MYKVPSKEISYCPIKFASFFSSQVKTLIPMWRRHLAVNNQLSRDILGIEYRDYRETLRATVESLI